MEKRTEELYRRAPSADGRAGERRAPSHSVTRRQIYDHVTLEEGHMTMTHPAAAAVDHIAWTACMFRPSARSPNPGDAHG